jgi:hypothetical protein
MGVQVVTQARSMTRIELDPLRMVFREKLEQRDFCRFDATASGLRCCRLVGRTPLDLGLHFSGLVTVNLSTRIGPISLEDVPRFPGGPVPAGELCLRTFVRSSDAALTLRLSVPWVIEEAFWQRLAWLLTNAVDARHAYEHGIEEVATWEPRPFDPADAEALFGARRLAK